MLVPRHCWLKINYNADALTSLCITMKIPQIVLLRCVSAPSLQDLSIATDGQKSHVAPMFLFQSQVLFCCLPYNSDETSLRPKVLSIPRAPDHKQMSGHFPTSPSVCQHWCESVVSRASPKNLEGLEKWRLIDKLGESNMAQLSISEPCLLLRAESACPPAHPHACMVMLWQILSSQSGWRDCMCVVTEGQCNQELWACIYSCKKAS